MNLLLLPEVTPTARLEARDPRLEHVRGVLRRQVGDILDVAAANGPRGRATITAADREAIELTIQWEAAPPPPPPPIHLLLGLPRPATCKKVITEATTLGVRSIHFFPTEKSDPAYARSRFWTDGSVDQALQLGAEQAFHPFIPDCRLHATPSDALDATPADALRRAPDVYEATEALSALTLPSPAHPTLLALGPERGWGAQDRQWLRAHGFALCQLGDRVLRVETAATVALTLLLRSYGIF